MLAQVQAEAAATWRSPHNGKPTVRGVERLRAWCEGFSLHAGVVIADHDREALERLCRHGTRPAFAHDQLAWSADGQIAYRLKRPWPDGRTELVLPPVTFLRRLCGIIPPPGDGSARTSTQCAPADTAGIWWCPPARRSHLAAHRGIPGEHPKPRLNVLAAPVTATDAHRAAAAPSGHRG